MAYLVRWGRCRVSGRVLESGRVARGYGLVTEDLVSHVKKFELYPEGKGELVKSSKGKSGTVCLEFGKVAWLLRASSERGETREKPGPRPQVREEEA